MITVRDSSQMMSLHIAQKICLPANMMWVLNAQTTMIAINLKLAIQIMIDARTLFAWKTLIVQTKYVKLIKMLEITFVLIVLMMIIVEIMNNVSITNVFLIQDHYVKRIVIVLSTTFVAMDFACKSAK